MLKMLCLFLLIFSFGAFAQTKATQKLFRAIEKNDTLLAGSSISAGADVNGVDDLEFPQTIVLLKAVELRRHDIVKLLLSQNADINQRRPSDFKSGLMIASEMNDTEMVALLLSHGADVNLETLRGETSLHLAASHGSVETARLLLQSREIDVNTNGEMCPLAVAAKAGHVGMSLLLKKQSGVKATSPVCLENAIRLAEKNHKADVLRILRRD